MYQTGWHAWFAPARTREAIVNRSPQKIRLALQSPQLRDRLLAASAEPVTDTRTQFEQIFLCRSQALS